MVEELQQAAELVDAVGGGGVGVAEHGLMRGAQPDEFGHAFVCRLRLVAQVGELR